MRPGRFHPQTGGCGQSPRAPRQQGAALLARSLGVLVVPDRAQLLADTVQDSRRFPLDLVPMNGPLRAEGEPLRTVPAPSYTARMISNPFEEAAMKLLDQADIQRPLQEDSGCDPEASRPEVGR